MLIVHSWIIQLTHGSDLAEDLDNDKGFQNEKDAEEDQRNQLIQCVEGVGTVWSYKRIIPVSSPAEASVECNVASTDKEDSRRTKDQSQRDKGSIIQELIADSSVHEENPCGRNDGGDMYGREGLKLLVLVYRQASCAVQTHPSHSAIEREPANGEDFANGDDDEAKEEELHFPGILISLC
jgi:hypothetical protein